MSNKKPQGHIQGRSTVTGQFVPVAQTYQRPATTVREIVPNPGYGDSGRYPQTPKK